MKDTKLLTIGYCRHMKDMYFRTFQQAKSMLLNNLSALCKKSEEELTKKDLLILLSYNFDFMRSLNLYNYYKDELTKLLLAENGEK